MNNFNNFNKFNNTLNNIPPQLLTNNASFNFTPISINDINILNDMQSNVLNTLDTNNINDYFKHNVNKPDFQNQSMRTFELPQNDWNGEIISSSNIIDQVDDAIKNLKFKQPSEFMINTNNVPEINKDLMTSISTPYTQWNEYKKGEMYYDNLNNDGKTEIIIPYVVVFDSANRFLKNYPDPFYYRVTFNPLENEKEAYISRNFKNVKNLSLDYAIMPRKCFIEKRDITEYIENSTNDSIFNLMQQFDDINSDDVIDNFTLPNCDLSSNTIVIINKYLCNGNKIIVFTNKLKEYNACMINCWEIIKDSNNNVCVYHYYLSNLSLEFEKFLLIYIDEITDPYCHSTNQSINRAFGLMFPNFVSGDYYYLDTKYVEKVYKYSSLGNINQMTIRIMNSNGIPIKLNKEAIDLNTSSSNKCICKKDNLGNIVRIYSCACTYMRHPYYVKFQNTLVFKISYADPDIDKRVFN